jgi:butyrate kinase
MQLLIVNPGATSTKIAVYEDETERFLETIRHTPAELEEFDRIIDQLDFRKALVLRTLDEHGYDPCKFDAICSRGGLLRHVPSGTYRIDDAVVSDIYSPPYGEHASSLGPLIAKSLADRAGIPAFLVDPVSVDEMQPLARVSGLNGMERESFFHALNQKAVARKAASSLGKPYEAVNLIVVHTGGGVSVAAHERGRVIDVFNVKDDGSFSMDRGGALPVNAVVDLCFSGKSRREVRQLLGTESGVFSYLGTRDFREVESRMLSGDETAARVFRAMAYQHAKDVGAMAAVLKFNVDAIVLTGGVAHSDRFCAELAGYVEKIAPVLRFPARRRCARSRRARCAYCAVNPRLLTYFS